MSEPTATSPIFEKNRRAFLLRKLHSLSGVVPVGAFMMFHLWTNAKATQGQEAFDHAVHDISSIPFVMAVEFAAILFPLLFHTVFGFWIALAAKHNPLKYTYSRNWMYTAQRVTGFIAFAFIALHLYDFWWPKMTGSMEPAQFYPQLCEKMSATKGGVPLMALWYLIGIGACVFHFANGLFGFCFSWGITVSRRSQRMAAWVFGLVGVALFFIGANTAIYFATGEDVPGMLMRVIGHEKPVKQSCRDVINLSQR